MLFFIWILSILHLGKELRKPFTLVSVNKNLVKTDFPIVGGEEVAFLPPVTGG